MQPLLRRALHSMVQYLLSEIRKSEVTKRHDKKLRVYQSGIPTTFYLKGEAAVKTAFFSAGELYYTELDKSVLFNFKIERQNYNWRSLFTALIVGLDLGVRAHLLA